MKGTITLQWQIRRKSKLSHVRGKAGVLKVKWKSYKSLCLGKRSLQNLAVNSGFYRPPTVPDSLSLPIPEWQQRRLLGWELHGVGDTIGGNRTYSAQLHQWALLGLCWVSFQVTINKKAWFQHLCWVLRTFLKVHFGKKNENWSSGPIQR